MQHTGAASTDAAATQQAKTSFENIIRDCLNTPDAYVFQGGVGVCKFCDGCFKTPLHPRSANHKRRVLCTELFEAHDQFRAHRTLDFLERLRNILKTRNETAELLLRLDPKKWLKTSRGQNDNRRNLDGARIWFTAFIVELGQTCTEIVQDPETDGSFRQTATDIQEILKELQKPQPAGAFDVGNPTNGSGTNCVAGGVADGGNGAYGFDAVGSSPAFMPAGRPGNFVGRDGAAGSMAAAGSAWGVRSGGDADEVGFECAASRVPR
jgi:hypothetical protein